MTPRAALRRLALVGALAFGVGATVVSGSAGAEEASRLDAVLERGVLRVGTPGDYAPFARWQVERGTLVGMDVDLAEALGAALGVKVQWVKTSWPALMADLAAGKFDLAVGGVSVSLERQKRALFSAPYLHDGKTPITRCENVQRFQTLAQIDRPGVRAVVNPGGTNERFARAYLKAAQISVHPDNTTIFDEIVAGRADLMITDAVEARLQQKLRPALCAVHPDAPFDYSEKAFLLPRDFALKAWVDQWLHLAQASGEFERIQARWIPR
ncbi:transporter substrate-binding domain-containing protein [Oryzomicrobium sp.]|uniref:transporter substrate-binding domain-containing protein n=1 Tax=Oryzomicrobium sp. TaxID=1911578 RepID=UPI002FE38E36